MIYYLLKKIYKFFFWRDKPKKIKHINSTDSFIIYLSDDED